MHSQNQDCIRKQVNGNSHGISKNNLGGIEESLRPFITELIHLCIGRWCTVTSEWTLEISSAAET